jgi:penicillin amidase
VTDPDILTGNQHPDDVETIIQRLRPEAVHPDPRRPAKFPLLPEADGPHRAAELIAATRLDLHEGDLVAAPNDQVDIAVTASEAMRDDGPPLSLHPACSDAFAKKPERLPMVCHGAMVARDRAGTFTEPLRGGRSERVDAVRVDGEHDRAARWRSAAWDGRIARACAVRDIRAMRPSPFGTVVALLLLAGTSYVSARSVGPVPALGPLLDPVRGVWSSVRGADLALSQSAAIPGLTSATRVVYDDRHVPHIFAANSVDAYRALGYVVARDRLFQIELQGRAGAGTLTELAGAAALPVDRETRAAGMPRAAERRLARADTTSPGYGLMQAYVDGVNAYVDGLRPGDYPLEYKLLGRAPRRMQVLDILHLFNRMGATLATSRDELDALAASARVGREAAQALFPAHAPIVEPIQPNGSAGSRIDLPVIPPPGVPDSRALSTLQSLGVLGQRSLVAFAPVRSDDAVGSNNWAVSPSRSASGTALLAGDPHLELTLPSIWYESHVVVRDSIDVYGVGIPGLPGIVIGFTRSVAWTFTNTGADVMDYYEEATDRPAAPTRYRLDGAWKALERRIEVYWSPTGQRLGADTLYFTHRGPMRRVGSRWISTRWTVLEADRDFEAFDRAARVGTSDSLLAVMAQFFAAPAQNMLTADTLGTIGIQSTGRFPLRPGDGRGDVLRDGRTSSSDWTGYWSVAEYPQSVRPAQGFLASANQEPIDPLVQPRYLGANWERPWRALRINTLLRLDSAVTPDAMRRYQSDPGSARADLFVPALMQAAAASTAAGIGDARAETAARLLGEWDRRYTTDNRRAVLFEEVMRQLARRLWDEFATDSGSDAGVALPNDMMMAVLLQDSTSAWWDVRATAAVETRDALLTSTLAMALDSTVARYGDPAGDGWKWSSVRHANIRHLLGLPAFSRREIPVQGGSATLWPSTGNGRHGPSWRMVVELSSPRRAWAIYPGGQSGNPLSSRYDDRLEKWRRGELDTLRLPGSIEELPAALHRAELQLTPALPPGARR